VIYIHTVLHITLSSISMINYQYMYVSF